jgi:hypothetical protein
MNTIMNTTFYHGTSLEATLSIQEHGFDVGRSGSNAGQNLGKGAGSSNLFDLSAPYKPFSINLQGLVRTGIYVTGTLAKAMEYTTKKPHGGCILQLVVDMGNCLHLDPSNLHLQKTWQDAGFDSAHAPDKLLGPHNMEEFCIKEPRRVLQLAVVTPCDAVKAAAAGFKPVQDPRGPPIHWAHWGQWYAPCAHPEFYAARARNSPTAI